MYQVVCYWGTWANYRPGEGKFTPDHVNPDLCTHLIYSFAGLDSETWTIKTLDEWMDLEDKYGLAGFKKATDLKKFNPHLKVTLAIGGWNEGSEKYSAMASDPSRRKSFVTSAVQFLRKYNFDGLDLDWEYPAKRGGKPEDKENFIELIKDLNSAFSKEKLLLTAAIGAAAGTIDAAYDVPAMYKYLDYVHVMCYDYHGKWDKKTGHNAPLYPRALEPSADQALNVEYTLNYLLKKGADPLKTVLGVPLYGRAFTLLNPNSNKMGAPAAPTSFQGPYTREDGFLGYNEICLESGDTEAPWTEKWEEEHEAPYMFRGDSWISYDNERSLRMKAEFAFDQGLAGVMTWSIDTDDFLGLCNGPKFPLLRTLNNALYKRSSGIYSSANATSLSVFTIILTLFLAWRPY
ncbi:probable chitinase 2 [Eurytemora carolleeae]|uniref:probable chitinase 2 n=1 Tax=Eurytemora carolleeae TaxID=1294199 RepID=UPI000C75C3F4|nr:probable chitinase 2 [Eurytemora carolleeae]|eukprot:XP_023349209.1 probable chitinase 2 [Eurytemora affinis]